MRQSVERAYDPKPGVSVSTLAYEYPPDHHVREHAHGSDQLIYATRGVMEVASSSSRWLIPPQFAVWIPAETRHSIRMPAAVSMRTLYIRRGLAQGMPKGCAVFYVTPFLRELIVEAIRVRKLIAKGVGIGPWRNNLGTVDLADYVLEFVKCAAKHRSFEYVSQ